MNFGIIGLGNIANKFAKTLNLMNLNLYACASRDITKAQEFKNNYNASHAYDDYLKLLNDKNIDVVYISLPNNLHYKYSKLALENGINVICEKPFTINPNESIELYELAKNKNLFIMEALWIRFLPLYKELKTLIKNNIIGKINHIDVSYGFDTNDIRKKRKFDSKLGGGALLDIGIYNIGLIDMILDGNIEYDDIKIDYKLNEYLTDEYEKIDFKFKNNITSTSITKIGENIKREVYIKGDKGIIYIPDFQHAEEFKIIKDNKETSYKYPFEINGFEYQIRDLIESINNKLNESKIYSSNDSIRLMKLLYDIRNKMNLKFECE